MPGKIIDNLLRKNIGLKSATRNILILICLFGSAFLTKSASGDFNLEEFIAKHPQIQAKKPLKASCTKSLCDQYKTSANDSYRENLLDAIKTSLTISSLAVKKSIDAAFLSKNIDNYSRSFATELNISTEEFLSKNPIKDQEAFNVEANFSLAMSDCELMDCPDSVKLLTVQYQSELLNHSKELNTFIYLPKNKQKEELKKIIKQTKLQDPKAYLLTKQITDNLFESADDLNPDDLLSWYAMYVVHSGLKQSNNYKVFTSPPPELKEIWKPDEISFIKNLPSQSGSLLFNCVKDLGKQQASLPSKFDKTTYLATIPKEAEKEVLTGINANFSPDCVKELKQVLNKDLSIKIETQDEFSDAISKSMQVSFAFPKEPIERRISYYQLSIPRWIKLGCFDRTNIGLDPAPATQYSPPNKQLELSAKAVLSGSKEQFGHEFTHHIDHLLDEIPVCKKRLNEIRDCLIRVSVKNAALTPEELKGADKAGIAREDFATQFQALFKEYYLCQTLVNESFNSRDEYGHSAALFSLLQLSSIRGEEFSPECKLYLKDINRENLFDEKCIVMPPTENHLIAPKVGGTNAQ